MNEVLEKIESRGELILSRQIESYRAIQNRAGLLLGTLTIYISFYPALIKDFNERLQFTGVISFVISGLSILLTLLIIKHKRLEEGYGEHKFSELVNDGYEKYITYSISSLKAAIENNDRELTRMNRQFNFSLYIFILGLLLGVLTIVINYLKL
jgi:hypothetical protein